MHLLLRMIYVALLCAASMAWAQPAAGHKPERGQEGRDVMWVPTPDALVPRMLELAKVGANDTVIDLGSGDGRLVIMAALRGAKALGIEYDSKLVEYAKAAAVKAIFRQRRWSHCFSARI